MNITVYLGSAEGNDPVLVKAAGELGKWIGANGHRLIYGGSKSGLMGHLASAVLAAGGEVLGVEPRMFIEAELQYDEITQLIVTETMAERKEKMIGLGDAFIAFPGGTGTLEEITEVMSRVSLKQLDAPCILYDLNGYYAGMRALLRRMLDKGLSSEKRLQGIYFAEDIGQIGRIIQKHARSASHERNADNAQNA